MEASSNVISFDVYFASQYIKIPISARYRFMTRAIRNVIRVSIRTNFLLNRCGWGFTRLG